VHKSKKPTNLGSIVEFPLICVYFALDPADN